MPNYNPIRENLTPIKTHHQAVTMGRKGGLIRSKKKQWAKLKYCSEKCPYSSTCPFQSASSATVDKQCALQKRRVVMAGREVAIQPEVIESFFSIFERGKVGLLSEALAAVYKIRLRSANASISELHDYVHTLINLKKAFYPEKEDVCDMNITPSFEPPVWMTQLEAERRMRELKKKNDAIDTTATVQTDVK